MNLKIVRLSWRCADCARLVPIRYIEVDEETGIGICHQCIDKAVNTEPEPIE